MTGSASIMKISLYVAGFIIGSAMERMTGWGSVPNQEAMRC